MKIAEILSFLESEGIDYTFRGDAEEEVDRFSSLLHYKEGTFTWVKSQENLTNEVVCSKITLAFVTEGVVGDFQNVIYTPQSKKAFFSAMEHFYEEKTERPAVGYFTYISPDVKIGKNVRIGHNCTLDGNITIGDDTVIWNNVVLVNRVDIGKRCEIQSGTVIGHDGYGYTEDREHVKTMIKHFGGVSIGNDVRIGMNNVIARGVIDDTVLEDGIKIADVCHIGHNNQLEKNVAMISGCIVNGSCHIGENAYVAGTVIRNQSVVGKNAFIGLGAVVVKDVSADTVVVGNPARPFQKR